MYDNFIHNIRIILVIKLGHFRKPFFLILQRKKTCESAKQGAHDKCITLYPTIIQRSQMRMRLKTKQFLLRCIGHVKNNTEIIKFGNLITKYH